MNWKPTEGLCRTEAVVRDLEAAFGACTPSDPNSTAAPFRFEPIYRHRMTQVIASALDDALRDGSEQDALASVVWNGHINHDEVREAHADLIAAVKQDHPDAYAITDQPTDKHSGVKESFKKKRGRPPGRPKKAKPAQEAAP